MNIGERIIDEIIRQNMVTVDGEESAVLVWNGNAPEQLESLIFELCPNEIARLERENARLREILGRMYNAPNNCPCEVSDEVLAIWKEAGDILSNAISRAKPLDKNED